MEALGQLTGGVAHDFNNLLMVISGYLPVLKKRAGDDPKATRAVEAIGSVAQRGAALTRQLLTFSRRQVFNPAVYRLTERIEAFRAVLASSTGAGVGLITTISPDVWPVKNRCERVRAGDGQPSAQCARRHARRRHNFSFGGERQFVAQ